MEREQIRVACYARYSSTMQREESISAQMRAMKAYCDDNGWIIVKKYVDEAYSATTDKRPQFQQMIFDSCNKEFDVVLVHKLDRFARNRYDSSLYKQKLRKNGVRLCSVLERIDNSPESILLEGLLESINEFYSANLARESMKGMKENALQCLHNGGSPGLGYDVDDTQHIVINEAEAKIVVMIYSMYLIGYSCKAIAKVLNEEGYTTKAGKAFKAASIYGILLNEKYTGVYIFNRAEAKGYDHKRNSHRSKPPEEIIRVEGGIHAIISKEVWEAVQEKRKTKSRKLKNAEKIYLLSSKVFCGVCDQQMNGSIRYRSNDAPPFNVYVCHTLKNSCSNAKEIDKMSLESYIISLVQKYCNVDNDFDNYSHNSLPFREYLQRYIHSIIVYKNRVIVKLVIDGRIKSFRKGRKMFKTPTQTDKKLK